jgi:hypothetical protein
MKRSSPPLARHSSFSSCSQRADGRADLFLPPSIAPFQQTVFQHIPQYITMSTKINLSPWIDGLGVLQSVAKAVPVLGAPVEGSIEALKQILQYTQVGRVRGWVARD